MNTNQQTHDVTSQFHYTRYMELSFDSPWVKMMIQYLRLPYILLEYTEKEGVHFPERMYFNLTTEKGLIDFNHFIRVTTIHPIWSEITFSNVPLIPSQEEQRTTTFPLEYNPRPFSVTFPVTFRHYRFKLRKDLKGHDNAVSYFKPFIKWQHHSNNNSELSNEGIAYAVLDKIREQFIKLDDDLEAGSEQRFLDKNGHMVKDLGDYFYTFFQLNDTEKFLEQLNQNQLATYHSKGLLIVPLISYTFRPASLDGGVFHPDNKVYVLEFFFEDGVKPELIETIHIHSNKLYPSIIRQPITMTPYYPGLQKASEEIKRVYYSYTRS